MGPAGGGGEDEEECGGYGRLEGAKSERVSAADADEHPDGRP